jgi:hypothetical protein
VRHWQTMICALVLGSACGVDEGGRDAGWSGLDGIGGIETDHAEDEGDGSVGGADDVDDVDDGPKFDVPHTPDAPSDCGPGGMAFSYIWIANSTQGTVSKIDTRTGIEEGRYRTSPDGSGSPSRTSVNQFGDVAVGNRTGSPRITKIAATIDRCVEKNGIPGIQTSTGPDDVLDWGEDECVLWSEVMPEPIVDGRGPRAIAWEGGEFDPATCHNSVPNPRLWVGYGRAPQIVYRLDGSSGNVLDSVDMGNAGSGLVYGGGVDAHGNMWMINRGADRLLRVDAMTLGVQGWDLPLGARPYGMGVDSAGHPWVNTNNLGPFGDRVYRFDPQSEQFVNAGGPGGYYRGMNHDRVGRAWVAGNKPCRLAAFDAQSDSVIDDSIALPGCDTPVGISIDHDGFVWVVDQNGTAYKVDPDTHQIELTVTGLTGPYTYSDMTGAGLDLVVNPPG